MSPEQIEAVRQRWSLALRDPERLEATVAEGLDGPAGTRTSRARWTVGSVTRLSEVLDRPTTFAAVAATEFARRTPVTLEELALERDALMNAIRTLGGELGSAEERAWALAFGLFEEIVVALWLDPFHSRDLASSTTKQNQTAGQPARPERNPS